MTLKTAISFITAAILASFLTILFVNSNTNQRKLCELSTARFRRAEKIQVLEEVKKNDNGKEIKKEMVILKEAAKTGAVCLDGSPPGYYLKKGWFSAILRVIFHYI